MSGVPFCGDSSLVRAVVTNRGKGQNRRYWPSRSSAINFCSAGGETLVGGSIGCYDALLRFLLTHPCSLLRQIVTPKTTAAGSNHSVLIVSTSTAEFWPRFQCRSIDEDQIPLDEYVQCSPSVPKASKIDLCQFSCCNACDVSARLGFTHNAFGAF